MWHGLVWFVVVGGGVCLCVKGCKLVCFEVFLLSFSFPFPFGLGSLSGLTLGFCNEQRNAFVCLTKGDLYSCLKRLLECWHTQTPLLLLVMASGNPELLMRLLSYFLATQL